MSVKRDLFHALKTARDQADSLLHKGKPEGLRYEGEARGLLMAIRAINAADAVDDGTGDGTEVVVQLADGWSLRSDDPGGDFTSGGYVRLCRPDGSEYVYWDSAEWEADPVLVMGAIVNAAAGVRFE